MAEIRSIARSSTATGFMLGRKLDSIPFSPYHISIIMVLGFVGFVEGYDLSITGSLLVLAKHPLHLTPTDIRFVAVASTLMACVGGFTASAMSDHWSRKLVMQIGVIATTFFTLLVPLVQTAEQLIIVRLLTGLGGGFAVSAAFPIAAELMPAQHRRTYGGIYEMLLAASAQMPARALGDHEMDQCRRDENHQPTRQGHQPKRVRIAGQQEADQ